MEVIKLRQKEQIVISTDTNRTINIHYNVITCGTKDCRRNDYLLQFKAVAITQFTN